MVDFIEKKSHRYYSFISPKSSRKCHPNNVFLVIMIMFCL